MKTEYYNNYILLWWSVCVNPPQESRLELYLNKKLKQPSTKKLVTRLCINKKKYPVTTNTS